MIELQGLTKRDGQSLAVDDLSFQVQAGKVTGFLGPNGAGKSTSMRSAQPAGTITTAVAVLFAPPILGALVSNDVVVTVMDHLPAGLSTVLVSGTGERYSPGWRPCCSAPGLSGPWPSGSSPCIAATPDHPRRGDPEPGKGQS